MSFDEQLFEFSGWKDYSEKYINPLSLFDERNDINDFVYNQSDFEKRRARILDLEKFLCGLSDDDKLLLGNIKKNKIFNISYITQSEQNSLISAKDVFVITNFICSTVSVVRIFSDFIKITNLDELIPQKLKESAILLVKHINYKGEISDTHPLVSKYFDLLGAVIKDKEEYKKNFVNKYRDILENKQSVIRDSRDFFVIKNDSVSSIDLNDKINISSKKISNSKKSFIVETDALKEFSDSEENLLKRIESEKKNIIRYYINLYNDSRHILKKILDILLEIDFYYIIFSAINTYDLKETKYSGGIKFERAFNPLLNNPVAIELESDKKNFLVTGVNGGGKTVFLKTLCFLVLQNQFFTYVSAKLGSLMPIFTSVYLDVFDFQSIKNGLSNFTSRIDNLVKISHANDISSSLLISDEIERGTTFKDGLVLYEAFRDLSFNKGFYFFVSTHNSYIKEITIFDKRVEPLSFVYDDEKRGSTYKLVKNLCFDSKAKDVLLSANFNEEIKIEIENLYTKYADKFKSEELLESTMLSIKSEDEKLKELKEKEEILLIKERTIKELEEKLNLEKIQLLEKERLISSLQKSGKFEFKQNNKSHKPTRQFKAQSMEEINKQIEQAEDKLNDLSKISFHDLTVGMDVILKKNGTKVTILEIDNKRKKLKVANGNFIFNINSFEIAAIGNDKTEPASFISAVKSRPEVTLDLRGKRYEEAVDILEKQIDSVLLYSLPFFTIVCGHGDGVMRQVSMDILKKYSNYFEFNLCDDNGKIDIKLK